MIFIWSRWGIVVLLFVGLGVLIGFVLSVATGNEQANSPAFVGAGLVLSAVALYFFVRLVVLRHLDRPRPAVLYEKLAQPLTAEDGRVQTHRVVPLVHPETGQQLMRSPVSTFFFVPVRFWPYLLGLLGIVLVVIGIVQGYAG